MYKISFLQVPIMILILSCSTEKPQLVLSGSEAFAYTLDEGWEVNATVVAGGFQQNEKDNSYTASLKYTVNIITPEDTLKNVDAGMMEESNDEEFLDLMLESQIELNSGFPAGEYQVIFIVEDTFSRTKDTSYARFNLTLE
jgi:hypothetical protein